MAGIFGRAASHQYGTVKIFRLSLDLNDFYFGPNEFVFVCIWWLLLDHVSISNIWIHGYFWHHQKLCWYRYVWGGRGEHVVIIAASLSHGVQAVADKLPSVLVINISSHMTLHTVESVFIHWCLLSHHPLSHRTILTDCCHWIVVSVRI